MLLGTVCNSACSILNSDTKRFTMHMFVCACYYSVNVYWYANWKCNNAMYQQLFPCNHV